MDQAELDKSMKLLELVENDVGYVVASSYLPDSASTPVKGASNIGPRGLTSHIRARELREVKRLRMLIVTCACPIRSIDPRPAPRPAPRPPVLVYIDGLAKGRSMQRMF